MNIVIIDDDVLVSSALKTILESKEEIRVSGMGQDGGEALRLYREHKPDVLLMDIRMKNVSGPGCLPGDTKGVSRSKDLASYYLFRR